MIDTIHLMITKFLIKNDNELNIISSNQDNKLLFSTISKNKIIGIKANYNCDVFSLDIKRYRNQLYCFIYLSIPKFLYGNNLKSVSVKEFKECLKRLNTKLNSIGIIVDNIFESELTRLDIFKNIELEKEFNNYFSIFENISLNRNSLTVIHKNNYTLFRTSGKHICFYDKIKESILNKFNIDVNSKLARIEIRLFKSKNVYKITGFKNVGDIINNYEKLEVFYNKIIESMFPNDNTNNTGNKNNLTEELSFYKEKYGRNYLNTFLIHTGINSLSEKRLKSAIDIIENNSNVTRKKKERITSYLKEIKNIKKFRDYNYKELIQSIK
ncbi:MAG TPA: hypothetical protein PLG34_10680 [Spirochaetota bacterium]|jgi:hypothetical protein|nr:hypothetical protein [Caldisericia bacterium]HNZ27176.1 hypothetical protein [Spirochaetota bacterium]HPY88432.1 hypothetical protein [Spirochaetota bacterium]